MTARGESAMAPAVAGKLKVEDRAAAVTVSPERGLIRLGWLTASC